VVGSGVVTAKTQRLEPHADVASQRVGIVTLLVLSAAALGAAPLMLPASYSWVRHAISESAAQGVEGAWVARLGLLLMGLAVLWLSGVAGRRWGSWGRYAFRSFGVLMVAAATFSHKPWEAAVPFDQTEDVLHSVAATGMGFAFAIGVALVTLQRPAPTSSTRAFDIAAIAASVLIPLGMSAWPDATGLLQRCMFTIAYLWYGGEALRGRIP
jgi:hypothetical protein